MRRYGFLVAFILGIATLARAQEQMPPGWTEGPTSGKLGSMASINVPEDYIFLNAKATKTFLEEGQNIPAGDELGALLRVMPNKDHWFAVFSYDDTGHIDDKERDAIDSAALMKTLKQGNEYGNKERQKRGWQALTLEGWHQQPFYDPATNNLTWATKLTAEGSPSINHSVRLLGRTGTMSVQLVADPNSIDEATREFNSVLSGYSYNQGQRYAEFVKGDKLAGYGLTALIAGGAGAAAVKSGLLQKFWKLIVLAFVALLGTAKKLFAAVFGKKDPEQDMAGAPTASGGNA
jgi:uncharacterized membrane-anchored protein